MERVKFLAIDSWNRPIFKSLDKKRTFYGCPYRLFSHGAKESEVLKALDENDLTYFGSFFDCEPMGTMVEGLEIVRGSK